RPALRPQSSPMIRGNVAVVRHGATAPSTQSGAVLLELSPSRMRDSGWDQLPPDVRFAGEALQKMRAPPWIAIYPNQPLTVKKSLATSDPSTPGTKRKLRGPCYLSVFGEKRTSACHYSEFRVRECRIRVPLAPPVSSQSFPDL